MNTQPIENQTTQTVQPTSGERTHRGGRAAMAIAALAVAGVGLTAFAVGVTGGSDAETPPAPDIRQTVKKETLQGVDQRLYELADKHAARLEKSGPGPDRRLYELAEKYAAEMEAQRESALGADRRLYELAEQYAAEQEAQR